MDQTTTDIGSRLRQAREELAAIEHNDFGRLPGGVFRRSARFEAEPPVGPLPRHEADWKNRLRLPLRLPAVLVTIVGILICGSLILVRGPVPREASDGRVMLNAVEAGPSDDTAQTDDSDGTKEVAFPKAAIAHRRAPSLRLEILAKGPC